MSGRSLIPSGWRRSRLGERAFTMVEIALCLAIIGFALVAIIGVLPTGLNVQRDNRDETIINQDAAVWINAIRNGAAGYNDLTNYVICITNTSTKYLLNGNLDNSVSPNPMVWAFTRTNSLRNGTPQSPPCPLTNGFRIVGLLSTPKYDPTPDGFWSNYVVAVVQAMSGSAVEKYPQTNFTVLDGSFSYRLIAEVFPYVPFDTNWIYFAEAGLPPELVYVRSNNWRSMMALRSNSWDMRLTFRWPVLPRGVGNGRQTYRTFTGGIMAPVWDPWVSNNIPTLHFLQPTIYSLP